MHIQCATTLLIIIHSIRLYKQEFEVSVVFLSIGLNMTLEFA